MDALDVSRADPPDRWRPAVRALLLPAAGICAGTLGAAAIFGGAGLIAAVLSANVAACAIAVCWQPARAAIGRLARRRQLANCRQTRARRIGEADGRRQIEFEELVALVAEIEHLDPGATSHYELDRMLDDYVEVAAACWRMARAAAIVDRESLSRKIEATDERLALDPEATRLRRGVLERRARCWDECAETIEVLRARLEMIADYVRLISERVVPGDVPADDRTTDIVGRLDGLDAAEVELTRLTA